MSRQLICQTEHVTAIEQDLGGDIVVVTFNELGFIQDGLRFWGDEFLLKQGISAIGIVTSRPNWYPRIAMDQVLAAIQPRIRGRRVLTYGHSQGGYGALKYASRLGASVALAFCPQWSIDPSDVATFDTRFIKFFDETLSNGLRIEVADLSQHSFAFFDKFEKADAANGERLLALGKVKAVLAPFTMHDTIRLVTEGRVAAALIERCTRNTPPSATELRQLIRAGRHNSLTYSNHMLSKLIMRLSHSQSRSIKFVSSALGVSQKRSNPFYLALIAHAKGFSVVAEQALSRTTPEHLAIEDLLNHWQMANLLRFLTAELRIAKQMCDRMPDSVWHCLHSVNTLIRTGELDQAEVELVRLSRKPDASIHIGHFAEFSLKLQKPLILESFLSTTLDPSERVSILFRLVDFYRRLGDRAKAFRKLMDLSHICANSPKELRRIATQLIEIREFPFALVLRERLLKATPQDFKLALEVVEARLPINPNQALSDLQIIMESPDLAAESWVFASYLYERADDLNSALGAMKMAVAVLPEDVSARHRLAELLVRQGHGRRAVQELMKLLQACRTDPHRLRWLGELARSLRDFKLAHQFAEYQFNCAPSDPECILYLAKSYKLIGDRQRAHRLLSDLFSSERRSPQISDQQWFQLAEGFYEVDDLSLARQAVVEALGREPHMPKAQLLAVSIDMLEKVAKTVPPPMIYDEKRIVGSRRLISRLNRMFRN